MKDFDLKKYLAEGKLLKENLNITPEQKQEFISRIKNILEDEDRDTAMEESGNILARVLTDDKAEFIEDVEDFGYNVMEVEDYAENLVGNL